MHALVVAALLSACQPVARASPPKSQGEHMEEGVRVEGVGRIDVHDRIVDQLEQIPGFTLAAYASAMNRNVEPSNPTSKFAQTWAVDSSRVYQGDRPLDDVRDVLSWFDPQVKRLGWEGTAFRAIASVDNQQYVIVVLGPNKSSVGDNQYEISVSAKSISYDEALRLIPQTSRP
jgi:hypothetical protein